MGQYCRGQIIGVTLTLDALVRMLDLTKLSSYRRGQRHHCTAKQSPVRMRHAQLARLPARQVGSSINDFAERSSGRALLRWQMSRSGTCSRKRKVSRRRAGFAVLGLI
ncbi:MAG: DUF1883 domain-containing protein [Mesorhizobium sp.]|nr:DUF1883 domain-containing protein [Mesorhizobium sp. M4A.F.Ca.ET.020.02.1.1]RWC18410.1 MAG: DUF1883 domain-containing protein [Mesorhizobium sp.]RWC27385.1 MAG: DUF1883 domain-containing protein [Mesorhizobium sp.]RWC55892.1 MAG: DUF1883 domain-containing protein [Mesorhizobium sp.]RWD42266.1 MAG: DUF1883 domain-containing protein [Mesorhizobium sp.]